MKSFFRETFQRKNPLQIFYKKTSPLDLLISDFCVIIAYMKTKNSTNFVKKENSLPEDSALVCGRNAVSELLRSDRSIEKIFVQRDGEGALKRILFLAKEKKIPVSYADKSKLNTMAGGSFHQGVVALAGQKDYATLEDLFAIAKERGEDPFFVLADGVEDPHNLGALIRCCEGAGAHGIIIPKANAVGLTPTVLKSSAGAAEHLAVCRVSNLSQTVDRLKKEGLWIYACEADGNPYDQVDYKGPIGIILGSEGFGISRLLKEKSDFVVSLPMRGKVNSLNVSCAGAIVLYEAIKSR